jgi:hypothetical protein
MRAVVPVFLLAGACSKDGASDPSPKSDEQQPHATLAGVDPEAWNCASVAPLDALGQVLGGNVRVLDSPMSTPRGVPHPCNYEVEGHAGLEYWTFDVDCRDGMKQRADALFEQYKAASAEMVAQYNAVTTDAGVKNAHPSPTVDAGPPPRAPELAAEVPVGAKGLDHHGQGLIFIDDDAPCYVRVVGPDAARRLELAKMLAKNLTFANAPMKPRSRP